jgi:hypothetical protein
MESDCSDKDRENTCNIWDTIKRPILGTIGIQEEKTKVYRTYSIK